MPFSFKLPTTSSSSLGEFLTSPSHPSLPFLATTHRSVVRDALKKHKRLPDSSAAADLPVVIEVLNAYLPYLLIINAALSNRHPSVLVTEMQPVSVEWRPTLTRSPPGRSEAERAVLIGRVSADLAFVLQTLGYVHSLQARTHLFTLYQLSPPPSQDQRAAAITAAMKSLLEANSIHNFAISLDIPTTPQTPADIFPATTAALASLALAEATLITVLKDDPYTAAVIEARNATSKDWMISPPSIPKVRAHLFARLCRASADHATKAHALLAQGGGKLDDSLLKYVDDLSRTARAKAARWLGIDAECTGKTGEAIAWMRGGRHCLGFLAASTDDDSAKRKGFKGLKQSWQERKEDKRVLAGDATSWGLDAGKLEEARVLEWLEGKWTRENDTINTQLVPPFEPLLAAMPSGREYHVPKTYTPPTIDAAELDRMRVSIDSSYQTPFRGDEADSGDDDVSQPQLPGAFPGTAGPAGQFRTDSPAYY